MGNVVRGCVVVTKWVNRGRGMGTTVIRVIVMWGLMCDLRWILFSVT